MDNLKAVAYLDTLGFSQAVLEDIGKAALMLTEFNDIVDSKLKEKVLHPSNIYVEGLKSLAKRTSFEDIEYFMPFSDSIFATSTNPDQFLLQMGHFVYESFMMEADSFAHPVDRSNPTLVQELVLKLDDSRKLTTDHQNSPHQPLLFRGGFAYGEVYNMTPTAIVNGDNTKAATLAGEAVVRAVGLEKGLKGPRLSFGKELYEKLGDETKKYCRIVPENNSIFEFLWPSMGFVVENCNDYLYMQEIGNFHKMFKPAFNLWNYYKSDSQLEPHYSSFIKMIIASTIQVFDVFFNDKKYALQTIESSLGSKGVYDEFKDELQ